MGLPASVSSLEALLSFVLVLLFFASLVTTFSNNNRTELTVESVFGLSYINFTQSDHLGLPAADGAFFFPMVNSQSYSSVDQGYSLGILAMPSTASKNTSVYNMYLSICRSRITVLFPEKNSAVTRILGSNDLNSSSSSSGLEVRYSNATGSLAVLVWNAHPGRALNSVRANLTVSTDGALELMDSDGTIVWNVSNATSMEMQDSGNLKIYTSADDAIVYQSFEHPSDTLVKNQVLRVGMELVSKDFTYSMSMKPGGLRFALRSATSGYLPYWQLPVLHNSSTDVTQAFCEGAQDAYADAYAVLEDVEDFGTLFQLYPGSCNLTERNGLFPDYGAIFDLVRLEIDGWLHFINFSLAASGNEEFISDSVPIYTFGIDFGFSPDLPSPSQSWGFCDGPLACGQYSICSKLERFGDFFNHCSCPLPSFTVNIAPNNSYLGCKLYDPPLPDSCDLTHEAVAPGQIETSFLQLDNMAAIFLLSGAIFDNKTSSLENCMQSCYSSCSCTGFFYVKSISLCFPMEEGVTFLNVTALSSDYDGAPEYVTYLKLAPNITVIYKSHLNVLALVAIIVLSLLAAAGLVRYARDWYTSRYVIDGNIELLQILPSLITRFSYRDLHTATQGFTRLLGAGAFASVYAGTLADGREIAVKKLQLMALVEGSLSTKQFIAEITAISQTGHVNIVNLLGFCLESSHRLLVYEYIHKGSLDRWLFHVTGEEEAARPLLDWATRFKIAMGVARGLTYLHEECSHPILHLDIKPQNILLNEDFEAKIADFGFSRLMSRDMSQVVTTVRGTPGYMAPELFLCNAAITKKCDVYSMGMVFLEIIRGRKNVDISLMLRQVGDMHPASPLGLEQAEEWHLPSWAARKCKEGKLLDLVDKRLEGAFLEEEARRLVLVAMWCLQQNPIMRPATSTVTNWLDGTTPVALAPPFSNIAHAQSALSFN